MKFGQLIEYNMRNIFLEKSYAKYGGEASLRSFYKKSNLNISLDQQSEHLSNFLLFYVQVEDYQVGLPKYVECKVVTTRGI